MHKITNIIEFKSKKFKNLNEHSYLKKQNHIVEVAFTSNERYDINDLIVLKNYLLTLPNNKATKRKRNLILKVLNSFKKGDVINDGVLYSKNEYGYYYPNKKGRIYSTTSIAQRIPKDIRFILFANKYTDVDIVNSHPSILMEFCASQKINVKALKMLVEQRSLFYTTVEQEFKRPVKNIKTTVHIYMNKKTKQLIQSSTPSPLLNILIKEVLLIRIKLAEFLNETDPEFFKELVGSKKSIQSLYCFSIESKYLMDFYHFLTEKLENNSHYKNELFIETDYSIEDLSFIPFFDGALISHTNYLFNNKLPELVKEYNHKHKFIKFAIKDFEFESSLITLQNYQNLKKVHNLLASIKFSTLNKIVSYLNLKKDLIDQNFKEKFIADKERRHSLKGKLTEFKKLLSPNEVRIVHDYTITELLSLDIKKEVQKKVGIDVFITKVKGKERYFEIKKLNEPERYESRISIYTHSDLNTLDSNTIDSLTQAIETALESVVPADEITMEEFSLLATRSKNFLSNLYKGVLTYVDSWEEFVKIVENEEDISLDSTPKFLTGEKWYSNYDDILEHLPTTEAETQT